MKAHKELEELLLLNEIGIRTSRSACAIRDGEEDRLFFPKFFEFGKIGGDGRSTLTKGMDFAMQRKDPRTIPLVITLLQVDPNQRGMLIEDDTVGDFLRHRVEQPRQDDGIRPFPLVMERRILRRLGARTINETQFVLPEQRDAHGTTPHGVVVGASESVRNNRSSLGIRRVKKKWMGEWQGVDGVPLGDFCTGGVLSGH